MKKAFLRIDDFPYSGEMYAKYEKFRDLWRYRRFMQLVEVCHRYGVVPEIMVSSHVLRKDGALVRFDEGLPKTMNAMSDCFSQGLINVNAHGMTHIDDVLYLRTGEIDAREFLYLNEAETREHLLQDIKFIREIFGKEATGFVAPAWGYNPGITKRVAAEFFLYIADSYDHWKQGACLDFGVVDSEHGFVHFPETWRYGLYESGTSVVKYWEDEMRKRDLVHIMQHGYRIPGTWKTMITFNPVKAVNHLLYGNLTGIFEAAMHTGVVWGSLENEALHIRKQIERSNSDSGIRMSCSTGCADKKVQ